MTHPASTTHVNLTPEELAANGIGPGTIRVSVGLEHPDDIVADFEQALAVGDGMVPELIEVELYRQLAEAGARPDHRRGRRPRRLVPKRRHDRPRRCAARSTGGRSSPPGGIGKRLLLDVVDDRRAGRVLGLRFGMAGRLLVDDTGPIERLEYAPDRDRAERGTASRLRFADGGDLRMQDPRRLGGVELDPDEAAPRPRGLDDHAGGAVAACSAAAARRSRPGCSTRTTSPASATCSSTRCCGGPGSTRPGRHPASIPNELRRLHRHLRSTIAELTERGGSHTGDLHLARVRGSTCPRDGAPLERRRVGGRTTYSCPRHQR